MSSSSHALALLEYLRDDISLSLPLNESATKSFLLNSLIYVVLAAAFHGTFWVALDLKSRKIQQDKPRGFSRVQIKEL